MLYIFGSDEKLRAVLSLDGACPYRNAIHTEQLNGTNTLEFALPGNHPDASYVTEQALVAIRDEDQNWRLFEVKRVVDLDNGLFVKAVYCESAHLEMLDDHVEDLRPTECSATFALTQALSGTRWQAGDVADLGANSVRFFRENTVSAIAKILATWGGELRYRVTITGSAITGRYIDLLAMRGSASGKRFEYGKDMVEIERTIEASNVKTALYGYGKGEEATDGYGRRLTFADVAWSTASGDPVDKPAGQAWIGDPGALIQWGRPGARHRFGQYENPDITDPDELLRLTWLELQKRKEPLINYRLTVAVLERVAGLAHEAIRLGDTVGCINRDMDLRVTARVIEIKRNLNRPEQSVIILGNFMPSVTEDSKRIRDLANQLHDRAGIWDDKLKAGAIQTSWLEGVIDTLQNEVRSSLGYVYQTDVGITAYDKPIDQNPTKAIRIGGGILAIANSKDDQGEWAWTTFGTGDGFTANLLNAGKIKTNLIRVEGDTDFYWDGQAIWAFDPTDEQRKKLVKFNKQGMVFSLDGGTTVHNLLGFNGVLNTWQVPMADNLAPGYPMQLKFYIPPEMVKIQSIKLSFTREKFRTYSTGASTEQQKTYTASNMNSISMFWVAYTSTVSGYQLTSHNHMVGDHNHQLDLPAHSHSLVHGIYESTLPTNIRILVDSTERTSALGGGSGFNADMTNLDITQWITTPGWHTIELQTAQIGRLNAHLAVQCYVKS